MYPFCKYIEYVIGAFGMLIVLGSAIPLNSAYTTLAVDPYDKNPNMELISVVVE
jgi:hypothetical protein